MSIEREFIPYEQALEIKELGFNQPCFGYYTGDKKHLQLRPNMGRMNEPSDDVPTAPTFSQAFRFFREKYKLHLTITSISQESWQWHITTPGESLGKLYEEDFYTYEEAELECLIALINIVKNDKK